jgi:hypothetical protein
LKNENEKILEELFDQDQKMIKDFKNGKITSLKLIEVQTKNALRINNLITNHGFPFLDKNSVKAYRAAFLAVQHSNNITLMKHVIELFKDKTNKETIQGDIAYLIDRVNILQNLPQIYGTQYKKIAGAVEFFEIVDMENLDQKRKNLGLGTFAEYKKQIT